MLLKPTRECSGSVNRLKSDRPSPRSLIESKYCGWFSLALEMKTKWEGKIGLMLTFRME